VIPPLSAVTMVSWAALFLQFWKRRNLSILERYLQTNPCLDKTSLNYAIEFELDNHMLGISQLFALLVIILGFLKAQRGAITSPSRELALFQVLKPFFTCRWELRLEEDEIHARMPWDSAEDEPLIEQHAQAPDNLSSKGAGIDPSARRALNIEEWTDRVMILRNIAIVFLAVMLFQIPFELLYAAFSQKCSNTIAKYAFYAASFHILSAFFQKNILKVSCYSSPCFIDFSVNVEYC
jgi:hypothetical protein